MNLTPRERRRAIIAALVLLAIYATVIHQLVTR